jgi:ABC-type thiamine transport system ATPase subunit
LIVGDVADTFGGAVATLQSILLRILVILKRGMTPVLFLDESLGAMEHRYAVNMGMFLSELSGRMGLDILLITHHTHPDFLGLANVRYHARQNKGQTIIEKVEK